MNLLSDHATLFLKKGIRPDSQRAQSALLDELRSHLTGQEAVGCPYTQTQLDDLQRRSLAAKAQREQAQRALEKQAKSIKFHRNQPAPSKPAAKPAAKPQASTAKPAPATEETPREKAKREYATLTDEKEKRTYRIRHWSTLSGPITAPQPRK